MGKNSRYEMILIKWATIVQHTLSINYIIVCEYQRSMEHVLLPKGMVNFQGYRAFFLILMNDRCK